MYQNLHEDKLRIHIFDDERDMLNAYMDLIDEIDPDFIATYNGDGFDHPFMIERCKYLGIEYKNKYGKITMNERFGNPEIPFMNSADYLYMYKEMSFGKRESYSLKFISNYELGITKVELGDDMDTVFENTPNKFIAYNIMDVHLTRMLDEKLKYIDMHYNIMHKTNVGWAESFSTLRLIDGLL